MEKKVDGNHNFVSLFAINDLEKISYFETFFKILLLKIRYRRRKWMEIKISYLYSLLITWKKYLNPKRILKFFPP